MELNDLPVRGNILSHVSDFDGSYGQICGGLFVVSPNAFGHSGGLYENQTFFDSDPPTTMVRNISRFGKAIFIQYLGPSTENKLEKVS